MYAKVVNVNKEEKCENVKLEFLDNDGKWEESMYDSFKNLIENRSILREEILCEWYNKRNIRIFVLDAGTLVVYREVKKDC